MFYQARTKDSGHNQSFPGLNSKSEEASGKSIVEQLSKSLDMMPALMYLLITLIILLILLFFSSTYLVLKLDNIQEQVEFSHPANPSSDWQSLLHSQSSKKVQEYLNTNLEQISQVIVNTFLHLRFYLCRSETVWKSFLCSWKQNLRRNDKSNQ